LKNFESIILVFDGQRGIQRKASIHEMGARIIEGFLIFCNMLEYESNPEY
jgi:hypothetical protein